MDTMLFNILPLIVAADFCIEDVTAVVPITVFFDYSTISFFDRFYVPENIPPRADGYYKLSHFLITSFSDLNSKLIRHGVQVRAIIKENLISNLAKSDPAQNASPLHDPTNFCKSQSPAESAMKYFESLELRQPNYIPGNFMLINHCGHMSISTSSSNFTSKGCNNVVAFRLETIGRLYNDMMEQIPKMLSKVRDSGHDIFQNSTFHLELCTYVRNCVVSTASSVGYFVDGLHLINDAGELKSLERRTNFTE